MTNNETGVEVVWLNIKDWKHIAVGLILFVLTGTLGSIPFAITWSQARAADIKTVEREQTALVAQQVVDREQKTLLTDAVVELKEMTKANSDRLTAIDRELKYNRCMDEKNSIQACVSILLK